MSSNLDLSTFSDGFQRTLYQQFLAVHEAIIALNRGDTLVSARFEPMKVGSTDLYLPEPLWEGQLVLVVTDGPSWMPFTSVDVITTSPFDAAGHTRASLTNAGFAVAFLAVQGRWTIYANDGAILI